MPDRRTKIEREVADLLTEHVLRTKMGDGCYCDCGDFSVGRGLGASSTHARHLAEILYDAGLLKPENA